MIAAASGSPASSPNSDFCEALAMPRIALATAISLLLLLATLPSPAAEVDSATSFESATVTAKVDKLLASEVLKDKNSAPRCSDETFLRRATLDLTGQLPTPGQITAFVLDPAADKRARIVEELLASEDYGKNWGRYWRDVIMFRRSDERALISLGPLEQHLTQSLNRNEPWDKVATEFITAQGDVRENGATGLIMAQMGSPEDTVAEISRIFMGIQIQCAQCHDHHTDRWKREQFHQLAAFFPRVAVRPTRDEDRRSFEVVADDSPRFFRGNMANRFRGTPEHYMPDLDDPQARGQRMQPILFVSQQSLEFGTRDAERRGKLAEWITASENPWFAKALVNRVWSELVGEGFYEPVDDMGPDREPTAPQTIDYLAASFAASGYDVKWLYRTIAATEAYQRESRARRNANETAFAANCPQRLRSDQLYDALAKALGIRESGFAGGGRFGMYGGFGGPRGQINQVFSYDPSEPRDELEGSIPQALALMNAPQINALISASPFTPLGRLLRSAQNDEDVVVELYLRALARQPSEGEISRCLKYVDQVNDRNEAFEDILWALVNSTEFLYRR
jgi:hypothetical protein